MVRLAGATGFFVCSQTKTVSLSLRDGFLVLVMLMVPLSGANTILCLFTNKDSLPQSQRWFLGICDAQWCHLAGADKISEKHYGLKRTISYTLMINMAGACSARMFPFSKIKHLQSAQPPYSFSTQIDAV